ncbi:GNAT family N-acetyltransferase [Flavobacteriaceae bacterium TP-CH-4]|uniref:GNAT family N-acetyltransferase n=1 Tax=Pelagihabitans pacificus TaxID=2696054 RepID=A0A967AU57_9FLAO|nr:GNAT family protein [Pelagihabitans pacificus]NHF59245.1 GNAT family N-acetyltransferase [Pelagihabitans pacificus]
MQSQLYLEDNRVLLRPLEASDWKGLWPIAQQIDLYRFGSNDVSTQDKLKAYISEALTEARDGSAIPFCIYDKQGDAVVGCTRYGLIDTKNKVVHIGWTWIAPAVQGTGFNHRVKFLMLKHAFENMYFEKVEFRIDERNSRSRKAVEKLGASLEGILRKNVITKDGFRRSSCCYGILRDEWEAIKAKHFKEFL